MKLLEIRTLRWRVLAVCDHRGNCPVLEVLMRDRSQQAAIRMVNRLRQRIPENGPEFQNIEKVRHYRNGVYALREQPSRGPKPRVYFFHDATARPPIIVCTNALMKRNDDVTRFIEEAERLRDQFVAAMSQKEIQIDPYESP